MVACLTVLTLSATAQSIEIDGVQDIGPHFEPLTQVHVIPPGLKPLWLQALDRPEAALHLDVAQAVVRARRLGVAGLEDLTPSLVQALQRDGEHAAARLSIARALVELDAGQTAPLLSAQADSSLEMAEVVEPALARWDYRPMRAHWRAQLTAPRTTRRRLLLAIQSLGKVGEATAVPALRALVVDPETPANVRMESARALAVLCPEALEQDARELAADKSTAGIAKRLAAASLLSRHSGSVAHELLVELASDDEPAVVALAIERLIQLDPHAVIAIQPKLTANPDARVRRLTVELLAAQQSPGAVAILAKLLDDPHPLVRRDAANALVRLAGVNSLAVAVREAATTALDSPHAVGREQAALVIGSINHKPAADRLLKLLEDQPPTVSIAAAWALRQLAVSETGEAIFAKLRRDSDRIMAQVAELAPIYAKGGNAPIDLQRYPPTYRVAEQLILALGRMRFAAADPFLRAFIPKPIPQVGQPPELELTKQADPRAAAIWALGQIHSNAGPPNLVDALRERLGDATPIPAESALVRRTAAASLVALNARSTAATLREFYDPDADANELGRICGWAVEQFTGQELPRRTDREIRHVDWLLLPITE